MPRFTPAQRRMAARQAVEVRWSRVTDKAAETAAARQAFMDRFERQVDPDGRLDPQTRASMAAHARRAYFAKLALASSRARAARKAVGDGT